MPLKYNIVRSNRKTIAIQIKPDGNVVVRCPFGMKEREINAFVKSKIDWIDKHLSTLKTMNVQKFTAEEIASLRIQTKRIVCERAAYFASVMGVSYNRISVRAQHTRWGSCSSRGNLNFNCLLALVPMDVLDYVVVHELCHLKQMNHTSLFWAEIKSVLPEYEQCKRWLKENGRELIAGLE